MLSTTNRIVVIGHYTWFSNHFPEGWEDDPLVRCLDVDESDYSFLIYAANFRPSITLFYRPELYPPQYLEAIPGRKVAFLSEPLPMLKDGRFLTSSETELRTTVYERMSWNSYHKSIYYDGSKEAAIRALGWPIDRFEPLPIDTSVFKPKGRARAIDVCFLGKPTKHRIRQLNFLRLAPWRYVWIAHGIYGRALAEVFQRSKVVLNIHADGLPAVEPRIYMAAACGCCVLSETLSARPTVMADRVVEYSGELNSSLIKHAIEVFDKNKNQWQSSDEHRLLSVRGLISRL